MLVCKDRDFPVSHLSFSSLPGPWADPLCLLLGFPGRGPGAALLQRSDALATSGSTCVIQLSPGPSGGSMWLQKRVAHPDVSCGHSWAVPVCSQQGHNGKPQHRASRGLHHLTLSSAAPWSLLQGDPDPTASCAGANWGLQPREGVPRFGLLQLQRTAGAALEPSIQTQERVTQKELNYLKSSQLSTAEKSCPVVRYFKYNVFILYIFIHM